MHILYRTILFLSLPCTLFAGGSFVYEVSTTDIALASAGWAARANDPSTAFTNPAGMTRFKRPELELGMGPLFAHLTFDANNRTETPGSHGHANQWLPLGNSFLIYPFSDCVRFGLASTGYFGTSLKYNHNWVGRYYLQKTLMQGASLVPSVAYKINECWSVGFGLNAMYGFFRQRSAVNNRLDGISDGWVNLHDYRWGFGYIAGVLYEPSCHTRIGLQYISHVRLHFRSIPRFHHLGTQLEGLLTQAGIIGSEIDLETRVPESLILSAYQQFNDQFALMVDVGWQRWNNWLRTIFSPVNSNSVTFRPRFKNCWHFAGGIEWYWNPRLTLLAGIAYDTTIVKRNNRTFNFPVTSQWRFGSGARFAWNNNLNLEFGAELEWQGKMFADQSRGPLGGRVAGHYHRSYVLFITSAMTWKF